MDFFSSQFQIIRSRIEKHIAREKYVWNSAPGALAVLPKYADHLAAFPFFTLNMGTKPSAKFTAIILAKSPIVSSSASIMKLIKNVAHSTYVAQVSLVNDFELDGLVFFHPVHLYAQILSLCHLLHYPSQRQYQCYLS